jgi:sterol desaturase/sphingolipid hydroxylase (fatty acid hydroxylase superfamily)
MVPEQAFRKFSRNPPEFSRTALSRPATDERWVTLKPAPSAHHSRRTTMLRKLALGLVAAASLSAMALAPSAASAHPWGGWGGFHHFHGYGFGVGYVAAPVYEDGGCYVTRRVMTPYGYRLRTVNVCY